MFRRILLAALFTGLLAVFVPPGTAGAAACWGTSCNGLDPQSTGCATGARTLENVQDTGGWVILELRYSPSCNAVWARIDNFRGVNGVAKVIGYSGGSFAREELKTLAAYPNEIAWTKMISFTYLTYGCYRKFHDLWGWTEWCSNGY